MRLHARVRPVFADPVLLCSRQFTNSARIISHGEHGAFGRRAEALDTLEGVVTSSTHANQIKSYGDTGRAITLLAGYREADINRSLRPVARA